MTLTNSPPPDEIPPIELFDPADPRGRPEGAGKTMDARRRAFAEVVSSRRQAHALDEGRRLTRRREAAHLSIDELASRVGQSPQWILNAESGMLPSDVTFPQWVDLMWATRPGWPEEVRTDESANFSWVVRRGQFLREDEVLVSKILGLYD
jgi:transcriptional regulator with XRE-family HTH domain